MTANPVWLLKPDNVKNVEGNDFELLCHQLLEFEVQRRHPGGHVDGSPPKYVKDGGIDLIIEVKNQPRIPAGDFPHAFTSDSQTKTGVACKSGKNWERSLLQDAEKKATLEIIREGGNLLMMAHIEIAPTAKDALRKQARERIAEATKIPESELASRIFLCDANDIAAFYAYHPVHIDRPIQLILSIPDLNGFMTLGEWTQRHYEERSIPDFSADEQRTQAIQQLREVVSRTAGPEPIVVWVNGPPGVGKSRLVLEALEAGAGASGRVLASSDFELGRQGIHAGDAPLLNEVILVVDECPQHEVAALASTFKARAKGQTASLFLIGIRDDASSPSFSGISLSITPLREEAARLLIEQELHPDVREPELIARIQNLTEGYPWFAVLLAQAIGSDATALPVGATQWEAASLAIAGHVRDYGGNHAAHREAIFLRGKALLAVILTEGLDWNTVTVEGEDRLSAALEASWPDLKRAAQECANRGLIRVRQDWRYKYVTPKNLGRLTASYFLEPPLSLGAKIRSNVPELRADFYRRLEVLETPSSLLEQLAEGELPPFPDELTWLRVKGMPITFLARHHPAAVASSLRHLIEATAIDELRGRKEERRDLVFALEHACRRKNGFEDAEPALFRLAIAENESWSNNATGVWKMLFLGASLTHRSFETRLAMLEERSRDGDDECRLVALKGVDEATSSEQVGPGFTKDDEVDGHWPTPTVREIQGGKMRAWNMLCELTLDSQRPIAHKAREIACQNVRASMRWGISREVLPALSKVAGAWDSARKAKLREALGDIREFESGILETDERLKEALEGLASVIAPDDYHSRLLDVVGNWTPAGHIFEAEAYEGLQAREREMDVRLATEGLDGERPFLIDEIEWLNSEAAVRSGPFMFRVGELDRNRKLLPATLEKTIDARSSNTLALYLEGIAKAGAQDEVDSVLEEIRGDPRFSLAMMLTICRAGPTLVRTKWLLELLESGSVSPDQVGVLGHASWREVDVTVLSRLIQVLSDLDSPVARGAALDILLAAPSQGLDPDGKLLRQALLQVSNGYVGGTMGAYSWERGARRCLQQGDAKTTTEAAVLVITNSERYGQDDAAWKILGEAMDGDAQTVWESIKPLIERRDSDAFRIALELRSHDLLSRVPVESVLGWVGRSTKRSVWAAIMCKVQTGQLSQLARELIIQFGPDSPAANELSARAHSTDGIVSSIAGHANRQLDNARRWSRDPHPLVSEWGQRMVRELTESVEAHSAWEEFQERQFR